MEGHESNKYSSYKLLKVEFLRNMPILFIKFVAARLKSEKERESLKEWSNEENLKNSILLDVYYYFIRGVFTLIA